MSARSGNDSASAYYAILTHIVNEHKHFKKLNPWSDSCIPQNKNSIMAFLQKHILNACNGNDALKLMEIEQKFCKSSLFNIRS